MGSNEVKVSFMHRGSLSNRSSLILRLLRFGSFLAGILVFSTQIPAKKPIRMTKYKLNSLIQNSSYNMILPEMRLKMVSYAKIIFEKDNGF
ncbi:MAG: hypothetical protein COA83_01420 [Methylophaga sp.]|nr:MAG: hypothetical protein COA83_01420 [Methylophaga sp.]